MSENAPEAAPIRVVGHEIEAEAFPPRVIVKFADAEGKVHAFEIIGLENGHRLSDHLLTAIARVVPRRGVVG